MKATLFFAIMTLLISATLVHAVDREEAMIIPFSIIEQGDDLDLNALTPIAQDIVAAEVSGNWDSPGAITGMPMNESIEKGMEIILNSANNESDNITCSSNADCGFPAQGSYCNGEEVCTGDMYTCKNPGTTYSYCHRILDCQPCENGCSDGSCNIVDNVTVDCRADADNNGMVESGDLSLLLGNWGRTCPATDNVTDCRADTDNNGMVESGDLSLLLVNWGGLCPVGSVTPAPEGNSTTMGNNTTIPEGNATTTPIINTTTTDNSNPEVNNTIPPPTNTTNPGSSNPEVNNTIPSSTNTTKPGNSTPELNTTIEGNHTTIPGNET